MRWNGQKWSANAKQKEYPADLPMIHAVDKPPASFLWMNYSYNGVPCKIFHTASSGAQKSIVSSIRDCIDDDRGINVNFFPTEVAAFELFRAGDSVFLPFVNRKTASESVDLISCAPSVISPPDGISSTNCVQRLPTRLVPFWILQLANSPLKVFSFGILLFSPIITKYTVSLASV